MRRSLETGLDVAWIPKFETEGDCNLKEFFVFEAAVGSHLKHGDHMIFLFRGQF